MDLLEFDVGFCLLCADEVNIRDCALLVFLSRCHSSNQGIETGNALNSYVTGLLKPGNHVLCVVVETKFFFLISLECEQMVN